MTASVLRLGIDCRELRGNLRTGIRRYIVEVVRAAVLRDWTVIAYGDADTRLDELPAGVTARALRAPGTRWWDQIALPCALRRDAADVFLSPYYKGPLVASCPVVVTIHDVYFIGYPGRHRPVRDAVLTRAARLYARAAAGVITDSEHSKRAIVARLGVAGEKIRVIPLALGPEFRPALLSPADRGRYRLPSSYILYVGNFKPHKNLPRLLRAYATLPAALRRAHALVLAGGAGGGSEALQTLATALGIADHVCFPGRISDDDLPGLYSRSTMLVLPSMEEGFGLPALEAMACGAPVVAANRGALPEVVGDAGILVDPESEDGLARAMAEVLTADERRNSLRRRGLEQAARFTAERTADRVLALLLEVASTERREARAV